MSATWEEASRCPIHDLKGKEGKPVNLPRGTGAAPGSSLITLTCPQESCEYHDLGWTVQIRPDGTIPDPTLDRDKSFHGMPGWQRERARDRVEDLREEMKRQQRPGAEVSGRRRYFT